MASGETTLYDLPFPLLSDPVNVHGDIQSLAERIDAVLPSIGLPYHTLEVTNNSGESITKGDPVYISGYDSITAKPEITKTIASDIATFPVVGLAESNIGDGTSGVIVLSGVFNNINTSAYVAGDVLYVGTSGGLTKIAPASNVLVVGVVAKSNATTGIVLVGRLSNRTPTWGTLKAGLV